MDGLPTLGLLAMSAVVMLGLLWLVVRFDPGKERRVRRQAAQLLEEIERFRHP